MEYSMSKCRMSTTQVQDTENATFMLSASVSETAGKFKQDWKWKDQIFFSQIEGHSEESFRKEDNRRHEP